MIASKMQGKIIEPKNVMNSFLKKEIDIISTFAAFGQMLIFQEIYTYNRSYCV